MPFEPLGSSAMLQKLRDVLKWGAASAAISLALAGCGGGDGTPLSGEAQAQRDQTASITRAQQSVAALMSAAVQPGSGSENFEAGMGDWQNWGNAQVVAGTGTAGSAALQVGPGAGGAALRVPGITGGTTYRLTAQVRVTDATNGPATLGVDFYDAAGGRILGTRANPNITNTAFRPFTYDVEAPANTAYALVWIWKNGATGFAYLDDVAFAAAGGTPPPPPPPPPPAKGNLLSNGGFEAGMSGWVDWGNTHIVTSPVNSGASALSVGPAAGGAGYTVNGIVPGTSYRMTVSAKVSDPSETVFVGVNLLNQANTPVAQPALAVSSTSYSTVSLDITAPSDAVKAVVYVWKNAGSGLAYVDDYVFGVAPGSAPPPASDNMLVNGGFESGLANWQNWGNASTSTAQAAAGSFAAQVGAAAGGFGQNVGGVVAGKTYRVGALAKVSSADEVGYLGVRFTDDAGTRLLEQNVSFSSTAYSTAQFEIAAPENATRALVYVWKNAGSGFAYVDEVAFTQAGSNSVALTPVVSGLASPIDLQATDDGTGRLFVVEQGGTIRILQAGALLPTPFLDIRSRVNFSGEMGLLGVAFHPAFAQNQRFYVNYVRVLGTGEIQSVIAEYRVSAADANQADPASERILLTVHQPFDNHKAGQLAFGPDKFLYIALGDGGGSGGDPLGNGQNLQTLLGKMLRIDVDRTAGAQPYAIPADNPFAAGGGLPEIWASGFRNPFRFSFDTATGRLFVGDVGQSLYEEIDILQNGGNYGWNVMEGMHCFNPSTGCNQAGLTLPIAEYGHSEGNAVIGGYVYHGTAIPALAGSYVFGDFGTGTMWRLAQDNTGAWQRVVLLNSGRSISSFGRDSAGELYLVDYAAGEILKLAPLSP